MSNDQFRYDRQQEDICDFCQASPYVDCAVDCPSNWSAFGRDLPDSLRGVITTELLKQAEYIYERKQMDWYGKMLLDRIDNVHVLEAPLYSDDLCVAGRVDCIAEFDDDLAIIDFKTTKELKQESWLEKYFVQEAAYAYMYWERTGVEVKKLVTLSVAEDGQTQVVEKYDKIPYIDTLCQWIKDYRFFQESIK